VSRSCVRQRSASVESDGPFAPHLDGQSARPAASTHRDKTRPPLLDLDVLVIDNYDSYTYNLVQAIAWRIERPPTVVRNDDCRWDEIGNRFNCIVISPGPGSPQSRSDLGMSRDAILEARVPLLGVCLGHQAIAYLNGGCVVRSARIVHGGRSSIVHDGDELFARIPNGFLAVRYHSLVVTKLPSVLQAIAWTVDGELMALRHHCLPQWGVQFHPESVNTDYGEELLANFLYKAAEQARDAPRRVYPRPSESVGSVESTRTPREALELYVREIEEGPTAEAVFHALYASRARDCFWLDTSLPYADARFSYLGDASGPRSHTLYHSVPRHLTSVHQARTVYTAEGSFLDYIELALGAYAVSDPQLPFAFHGGYVGYMGYEVKSELGARAARVSPYPDAAMIFADRFLAFDHDDGRIYLVAVDDAANRTRATLWLEQTAADLRGIPAYVERRPIRTAVSEFVPDLVDGEYLRAIGTCQRALRAGESYEICLTTQLRAVGDVDAPALYSVLRRVNPAPYAAFLRFGGLSVLCSSPERFLRIDTSGLIETKPIKGTARRSADPAEDAELAASLRSTAKTVAENLMITDVLRNDLGRVAEVGTVEVPVFLGIESYASVHQLVSTIRARCRASLGIIDCLRATFPGGSMTGAPRIRSMEIIDRVEVAARGVYSGTLGYLSLSGSADLNIVIRTLIRSGRELAAGVGGAITVDSDPREELEEAHLKAEALLWSLGVGSRRR
jgi:para-aminobenzoate synthetase